MAIIDPSYDSGGIAKAAGLDDGASLCSQAIVKGKALGDAVQSAAIPRPREGRLWPCIHEREGPPITFVRVWGPQTPVVLTGGTPMLRDFVGETPTLLWKVSA
jgi:hypothetical protein